MRATGPDEVVWMIDQPPRSTGSLLVRRCTSVPQSAEISSRFIPSRRMMSAVISDSALICG